MNNLMLVESYGIRVYVIQEFVEQILEAVKKVTSLKYGNYDGVSWCSYPGVENCVPREGANQWDGQVDQPYSVEAVKIEFSIPRDRTLLSSVIEEICNHHPWDEPVICVEESLYTRKNGIV